jgi:N-acetylglucosamine-6-sulfatase
VSLFRALSRRRRPAWLLALLVVGIAVGLIAGLQTAGARRIGHSSAQPHAAASAPNIVFVLTDDLSMDLLPYMPNLEAMQQQGLTFSNYYVSDSLCCPSRSSIFTGNFPHDTDVLGNTGRHGGYRAFMRAGDEDDTFNLALQEAGYRTAMMGKYLNGYLQESVAGLPRGYIPPGWSEWDVVGWGYPEFNYWLNDDGTLQYYGHNPADYLTDVLANKGANFIEQSAQMGKPFFLELATFAPHFPYVPAPRDAHSFPGLTAPEPPNFNVLPVDAPRWLANHKPLTSKQIAYINKVFRLRVQSVQAVDRMIGLIEQALVTAGVSRNTYIVFSSDNGLHTGEYRLMPGKLTAFDTDIHVPLIVTGPGVPAGTTVGAMAENVDLAKTFTAIGGTTLPSDGASLLPLVHGVLPIDWRNAILVEHHHPEPNSGDPDAQTAVSADPPSYEAIRTHNFLYVEYVDGEREFYDLRNDPFELYNLAGSLSAAQLQQLHADLVALENCHSGSACWAAMHVNANIGPVVFRDRHGRHP